MSELPLPDPALANEKIALRAWRDADVPAIVAACQDPLIAHFTTVPSPYRDADARAFLAAQAANRRAGLAVELAIADRGDTELLGAIALGSVSPVHRRGTIGYWVAPAARGRGVATDALRLLAGWAFDILGLSRLDLTTDPDNVASQTVAERCGFRREGVMRSHWVTVGGRRDSVLYGLLPEDLAG